MMAIANRQLISLSNRLRNLDFASPEMYQEIQRGLEENVGKRMDSATAPDGSQHKPLSKAYVEEKIRDGYSPDIWKRTELSRQSITSSSSPAAHVITMKINTPYSSYPHKTRPVLGFNMDDREVAAEAIDKYFNKSLKGGKS